MAIFNAYRERAQQNGWNARNDRFAYAALVYVGDSNEEGFAGARKLMWYIESNQVAAQFINPPGYVPVEAAARVLRCGGSLYKYVKPDLENLIAQGVVCTGNPDTVFRPTKKIYNYNGRFGHLLVMGPAGFLDHAETVKGIDLQAKEPLPASEGTLLVFSLNNSSQVRTKALASLRMTEWTNGLTDVLETCETRDP